MRSLILLSAVVVMIAAGCSSSEPLSIDLAWAEGPPPWSVVISGEAVDEGVVCAAGTVDDIENELLDDIGQAQANGTVAEMVNSYAIECDDGSGTITIADLIRLDFAVIDQPWEASIEGTWTLEGSGDYESLTGSGQFSEDVDDGGMIHHVGEVEG